jgi:PAS domain S-box-containing protein
MLKNQIQKRREMKAKPVILVVDDQPQNIELLEAYLVPQGYEIVSAANGEEALEKLSGNQIDLILLDVIMPGMDGFEVTRRVRQDDKIRLLPIILITVLREAEDRIKGIEAGCDEFISYPVDKMELLARVRSLLKVKAYNDLMSNYRKELEIRVKERTAELERTRVALEQTNAYHRNLIEVSLDPLVTISVDGKITDVNKATIKATGRSRRELVGTDFSSYFTEPEKARAGYKKAFKEGSVQNYELEIKHRDGHLTPVLYNASLYYDEAGKAVGIFAATRDITVLKKAEADLREHRDQLEELVKERTKDLREREDQLKRAQEIANLGGWELDLTSNRLSWSDEVYRIFGLKPQEFKATYEAFLECVHPDDRAAVDGAYKGSLQEGRDTYEIEHRILRKNTGEIRMVFEKCAHFRDPAGRVVRSIGMVQDITLRKRTENEMRALNLRLEEINRQLNDFVFTVSHDLKAPLRAIQGYADALLEDQAQKLDPDGRANIERIAIASQRLDEMIQDLLAYSRISSEQITMEPVDLKTLVREVIDRLPPEAVVKNAVFSVDPDPPAVTAHQPLIEQILDNLVLNAVTYVKPGIRPEIKIWVEDRSGWTYLFVKDNGIGIAVENQERIFKVFERLHGVESYPGTGVGLAIVKKGVERMGGRFGVISKPSEGSTFWIALPREIVAKI